MITGAVKNKVDQIWINIAAGGITNPLTVIEQLTYLMFIRSLDVKEIRNEKMGVLTGMKVPHIFPPSPVGQAMRWSHFKNKDADEIFHIVSTFVFPAIKSMKYGQLPDFDGSGKMIPIADRNGDEDSPDTAFSKFMADAAFLIPTAQMLEQIITGMEDLYTNDLENKDMQGDLYEYMLGKLATAGQNGQFRTPKHIREMIVELLQPTPDDTICDPACGTSGFLVSAGEYLKETRKEEIFFNRQKKDHYMNHMFFGYDMDRTMLRIGAMNMMTHGIASPFIEYRDSLSDQNPDKEKYSLILANPPFKGSLDADTVSADLLKICKTKKTELLFLALFLRMLRIGGRCACIVPDGVLFGSSTAHKAIRKELVDGNRLEAVISMPSGVFKPYAGVSTAILIFTRTGHGGTDRIWFYDMKADGFSLDDKRSPVANNDIPDIIARFRNLEAEKDRRRTEKSFFVPKAEIVDNGYDLSINKYKETEYKPVEYLPTSEIMAELENLEKEIGTAMSELKAMLADGE